MSTKAPLDVPEPKLTYSPETSIYKSRTTEDVIFQWTKTVPIPLNHDYDYVINDEGPLLSEAMKLRDNKDLGLLFDSDTKTLRTLCNILIYSGYKLNLEVNSSQEYNHDGTQTTVKSELTEAIEGSGLNGVADLSYKASYYMLIEVFNPLNFEKVLEHAKGIAEWMRGPIQSSVNRNYDPLNEMGDAVELLINQPKLKEIVYKGDSWIVNCNLDDGCTVLRNEVTGEDIAVRYMGAGWGGIGCGKRVEVLVIGFKDYYWVDTGNRGFEDILVEGEDYVFDRSSEFTILSEPDIKVEPCVACENCRKCETESFKLNFCSRCKVVKYCCKECQKSDWKAHKICCIPAV
ncbi:hypothetical protein TL16_g05511 [Triparma laevis f. inornata]|uniref:MYND-type domain-containing protein n=1 Tax=Triparma laevis f. inornata TaxID=1714386 RepID=A0A9W7AHI8_9STRA|nr:hypothetical protein TL16_g05511 [Triparma laevis f. inornata]